MELRRRVEHIDRLRRDFYDMRSDLDRLVMHVPTALVPRGVGSIDLTTGLRGITAKSRCLRA
jgi:hypothetical protein